MTFQIKKAVKSQAKLRMAIFGPSGAGKTMTSLRIASGLGKQVGVIDTERGSAAKYSDRWPFDVIELDSYNIDHYTGAINAFAQAGHDVLIVDSLSHAWEWLLEFVDKLGATKYRGNKWSAWSEATPKQQALVDAILAYPGHVIATMRSKTEWVTETNERGKSAPVRVGVAPKQRDGVEYEFDVLLEMNVENVGRFIKDRTGKYQDVIVTKPGEELGKELAAWLSDGAPAPVPQPEPEREVPRLSPEKAASLAKVLEEAGIADVLAFASDVTGRSVPSLADLNTGEATRVFNAVPKQPARKNSIADEPITEGITAEELEASAADDTPPWGDDQGGMFPPEEDLPEELTGEPSITAAQLKAVHTRLTKLGFNGKQEDKDLARLFIGHMVGRALDSSKDLTKTEAGTLLDLDDDTLADALAAFKAEQEMNAEGAA